MGTSFISEFTPDMLFGLGDYVLELHYVSQISLSDEDRRCAVDVDAFTIVARTAMADNVTEMAQTSDIALALRGKGAHTSYGWKRRYGGWITSLAESHLLRGGAYATEQGDYAKEQGNYAKAQGLYAKDQGDYVAGVADTEFSRVRRNRI